MKISKALPLIVFMLGVCVLADQALSKPTSPDPLLEALQFREQGNYLEAEKIIDNLITQALPRDSKPVKNMVISAGSREITLSFLYLFRANCRYSLKRFDGALTDYTSSYELKENKKLLYDIADCMYEQGMYVEATGKYDEYLETARPDRNGKYLALRGRALSVFQSGDRDQAIRDLKELKGEFPELEGSIQNTIDQCVSEKNRIDALAKEKENKEPSETEK